MKYQNKRGGRIVLQDVKVRHEYVGKKLDGFLETGLERPSLV